ncbi:MAG: ZIP family metal transporter [Candidatus Nomurabacteria bacterium]|nr:ZIP family metal transporter [Candidatus Nomurabacteria bacterium]
MVNTRVCGTLNSGSTPDGHPMTAILLSIATFISTSLGGLFSIKYKDRLHLIMGFTAGVLLGVVSFDIFPEIIEQIKIHNFDSVYPMIALVAGFLLFHILEKSMMIHHSHEDEYADHKHPHVGKFSALALAGHSFMDGVGIGLGFQVNTAVGIAVALAVIAHDFTDGMNTVTLMLTSKNTVKNAKWFLLLDAVTPTLGVLSTFLFKVSDNFLVLYLGFFAGFLLYIGASDILPEAHSKHSSMKTVALTIFGALLVFILTRFI